MVSETTHDRISQQFLFLLECDRLKDIFRRTVNVGSRRPENDAEHSWAVCLLAMTLAEHSNAPIDLLHVIRMLLVHDLVEIDAGDTFAYDEAGMATQHDREATAASRIFGLLPDDQAHDFRALWDEFEAQDTGNARFAAAVDRLHAVLLNTASDCTEWRRHGVSYSQVMTRNSRIALGSSTLWARAGALIDEALSAGQLT
jgi:putative hydrolase of HD superfamily